MPAPTSLKRPSSSSASTSSMMSQGKRKVSRTEKGPKIVAGEIEHEQHEQHEETSAPSSSSAVVAKNNNVVVVTPRVRNVLDLDRDELGVGKSPARKLFGDLSRGEGESSSSR